MPVYHDRAGENEEQETSDDVGGHRAWAAVVVEGGRAVKQIKYKVGAKAGESEI